METDTPDRTWGRGVTAAQQTFNLHGEGSNPSGLIERRVATGGYASPIRLRPVAQWSEQAPYKGTTTVRLRPGRLTEEINNTGSWC